MSKNITEQFVFAVYFIKLWQKCRLNPVTKKSKPIRSK